jgi:hypothetical protein
MTTVGKLNDSAVKAARCATCGRIAVTNGICVVCGGGELKRIIAQANRPVVTAIHPAALNRPSVTEAQLTSPQPIHPTGRVEALRVLPQSSASEVRGRVIIVSPGQQEPMDFDPWRWVAIPVWGLLLLALPVATTIIMWQFVGFLPALGVAACAFLVLRFMFSDRLLQSWHFTAALNGRHIVEPMPVVMLRLRQTDDREIQLRLKGQFSGGAVLEGDRIRAEGAWRGGVFRVRQVFCERTRAVITPRQPNAFPFAIAGVVILVVVGLWLYLAGIPWVGDQAHAFSSSINNRVSNLQTHPFQQ